MLLDVAVTDPTTGVQIGAETHEFYMQGYTGPNQTGDKTNANWLIRSWDDLSLPPGESSYDFTIAMPEGVEKVIVEASLSYKVGDKVRVFDEASITVE